MVSIHKKTVIIIGAGFGGLSAAAYLARDGYDVTVLEKNDQPGGRAMVMKKLGYTFDLGPSWYMMPDVFDDFFADFGKKPSDYYQLKRLNPSYRVYTNKDKHDVSSQKDGGLQLFDDLEPGSADKVRKLLAETNKEYDLIRGHLLDKSYTSFKDLANTKALSFVKKPSLIRSYHNRVKKTVKNKDLQQILEFMVVFMGGSPQTIPALYSLLAHVDFNLGIWYPVGGFSAVVRGFEALCKELGVTFRYNAEVTRIETVQGHALAVYVGKERLTADIIIVNADYHFAETKLLDTAHRTYSEKYWQKKTMSPSGLLIFLGVNKKVPGLLHHTMFFDANWHNHFKQVFKTHTWVTRPLFYVCTPSKSDPTVVPKGKENIFILVPTAVGLKVDNTMRADLVSSVISRMEERMGTKFAGNIELQEVKGIDYFEDTFNAYKGNSFGLAHTLNQTANLRPRMQSKKVSNLFYVGQFTNPGTGVPIVILSGKVVAQLINKKIQK